MDLNFIADWTKELVDIVQTAPWWQYALILFFAAMIEYVFPLFPGDTVFVVGGFLAMHGAIRLDVTICALLLGTWAGTTLAWSIGKFTVENQRARAFVLKYVSDEQIQKLINLYEKYGNWLLFGNRFVPGVRGTFMIASGIVQMPLRRVLFWSTLSALLWNTLLFLAGAWFANNLDSMLSFFATYARVLYILMIAALLFYISRKIWKRYL